MNNELRDKLAEGYATEDDIICLKQEKAFKAGWNACLQDLSDSNEKLHRQNSAVNQKLITAVEALDAINEHALCKASKAVAKQALALIEQRNESNKRKVNGQRGNENE